MRAWSILLFPSLSIMALRLYDPKDSSESLNDYHIEDSDFSKRVIDVAFGRAPVSEILSHWNDTDMMQTLHDQLSQSLPGRSEPNILSFGASYGIEALAIKNEFPKVNVWGYDIDKALVETNRESLLKQGIHKYVSNYFELPPNHFDYIECNWVFMKAMNQSRFRDMMDKMAMLLKPSGVLEVMFPVEYSKKDPKKAFDPSVIISSGWIRPNMPHTYGTVTWQDHRHKGHYYTQILHMLLAQPNKK